MTTLRTGWAKAGAVALVLGAFASACTIEGGGRRDTDDAVAETDSDDGGGLGHPVAGRDRDQDGYDVVEDCDDGDAAVNPGRPEDCTDGRDDDCDGLVDADDHDDCGGPGTDADGDGASDLVDCDDDDPRRSPFHLELCHNLVDDDCDGRVDGSDGDCAGLP